MVEYAELSIRPDAFEISIPKHYCRPGHSFLVFWVEGKNKLCLAEVPNREGVQPVRFRPGNLAVLSFPSLDPKKKAVPTIRVVIEVIGRDILISI